LHLKSSSALGRWTATAISTTLPSERLSPARLRLPGSGGIPDVTVSSGDAYLYVPRHSRATFVERLDFCSGLGHHSDRTHGSGPSYLVSDLGQFDFANGRMRLTSFYPGSSVAKIQAHTGFELEIAPDVHETAPPSPEELRLLREEIDPLGIRRLESLSGASRRELLHYILAQESQPRVAAP
jgi:glutaconate CoA-transferase subunit B